MRSRSTLNPLSCLNHLSVTLDLQGKYRYTSKLSLCPLFYQFDHMNNWQVFLLSQLPRSHSKTTALCLIIQATGTKVFSIPISDMEKGVELQKAREIEADACLHSKILTLRAHPALPTPLTPPSLGNHPPWHPKWPRRSTNNFPSTVSPTNKPTPALVPAELELQHELLCLREVERY